MSTVVIVHGLRSDSRPTTVQNVLSYSRYLPVQNIIYVNCFGIIPDITRIDAVILTYDFLWLRTWPIWNVLVNRVRALIESAAIRVAMPQDDYLHCAKLDAFVCEHKITHVYSPITHDLELLYPRAVSKSVKFAEALTGYIDEVEYSRVRQYSQPFADREWDLRQRIRLLDPQLGLAAMRKGQVAVKFSSAAKEAGFACDVSTDPKDVQLGDDWYKFLGNTRFIVGAKGGVSATDPKGRLTDQVRRLRLRNPDIDAQRIQRKLRSRGTSIGNFSAISPRLFESAVMGACQILRTDDYVDGFEPWVHYVPVGDDLSGVSAVFDLMRDHERASAIVVASQALLLTNVAYTYRGFLARFAHDLGIMVVESPRSVTDSSSELDRGLGSGGVHLKSLQTFLTTSIAQGRLRRVERKIGAIQDPSSMPQGGKWEQLVATSPEVLKKWVHEYCEGRLILESLVIPWRTATSFEAFGNL